jgi:hypothetical protein
VEAFAEAFAAAFVVASVDLVDVVVALEEGTVVQLADATSQIKTFTPIIQDLTSRQVVYVWMATALLADSALKLDMADMNPSPVNKSWSGT